VQLLTLDTEAFHEHHLKKRGQKRIVVTAQAGDTWKSLAKRHGVTERDLERINRRSRKAALREGDSVVVYVKEP
jgi:hypothetical protein